MMAAEMKARAADDLGQYHTLLCRVLDVAEELARLTANTWDDAAVTAVHDLFHRLFGPHPVACGSGMSVQAVASGVGLPLWMDWLIEMLRKLLKV